MNYFLVRKLPGVSSEMPYIGLLVGGDPICQISRTSYICSRTGRQSSDFKRYLVTVPHMHKDEAAVLLPAPKSCSIFFACERSRARLDWLLK